MIYSLRVRFCALPISGTDGQVLWNAYEPIPEKIFDSTTGKFVNNPYYDKLGTLEAKIDTDKHQLYFEKLK